MRSRSQPERRRSRRIKIGQTLRIRPSNPKDKPFEEESKTRNASREGIYFITRRESYYPGMHIFLTLPFYSQGDAQNCEYLGQVMRVEELGKGERGIAVVLLSSAGGKSAANLAGAHQR